MGQLICILNISTYYIYRKIAENHKRDLQRTILIQENQMYTNQLKIMQQSQQYIRILRHDMKNHLQLIKLYLSEGEYEKAMGYCGKLEEEKEWNYDKNINLLPSQVLKGSATVVWWKCYICGNEWKTSVHSRTGRNPQTGCPSCSAQRTGDINAMPIQGENDLETLYPKLLKEWNYEKNTNLPSTYFAKSNKKVWWRILLGEYLVWKMVTIVWRLYNFKCYNKPLNYIVNYK